MLIRALTGRDPDAAPPARPVCTPEQATAIRELAAQLADACCATREPRRALALVIGQLAALDLRMNRAERGRPPIEQETANPPPPHRAKRTTKGQSR